MQEEGLFHLQDPSTQHSKSAMELSAVSTFLNSYPYCADVSQMDSLRQIPEATEGICRLFGVLIWK